MSTVTRALEARQQREQQEAAARREALLQQVSDIAIRDLAGELTKDDESTLPEIVDELGWEAADYDGLLKEIKTIRHKLEQFEAAIEASKGQDRLVAARRLAEHRARMAVVVACRELRSLSHMKSLAREYHTVLAGYSQNYPHLFTAGGLPIEAIRKLPCVKTPPLTEAKCCVCDSIFRTAEKSEFCGNECEKFAENNKDTLAQLGFVVPSQQPAKSAKKGSSANGKHNTTSGRGKAEAGETCEPAAKG